VNTDKYYLLEKEYQKKGIPYSPFLMYTPEELIKNTQEKQKEDDFDYYKTHILLENYDEEPEGPGEIKNRLEEMRQSSEDGEVYGYTKWFDTDGSRIWKKCKILEYDETSKMFHICVSNSSGRDIYKHVTRFNFLFSGNSQEIDLRVQSAEKWKDYARKYMAFYHFVSSFNLENIPNLISDSFMEKIFYLVFIYRGVSKPQLTPLQVEELENSVRFGIWRRHARKRYIEVEKNKLSKILSTKKISNLEIQQIQKEIKENYDRSFKIMEFYKRLPINYDLYMLLSGVIPKERFLMSSEKYLYSKQNKGTLQVENRHYPYLKVFKKIQTKLPQSEYDMGPLLIEMNKRAEEDLRDKIFFYKNWFIKPIQLKDFKHKNRENIEVIFKECHFLASNANYEIIKFLRERVKEAKKVNKGANISNEVIKKFREFQGLVNRKVATFTRELFHKSMDYMTEIFRKINRKVNVVKSIEEMSIEDIISIRDDYNLEDYFTKSFDILQFYFEMNYSNGIFSIEPSFDKWWKAIEKITRSDILGKINKSSAISVYDLLSKEEQDNYYIDKENNLIVFYEDDTSYEEELIILKKEMQRFFSLINRFCDLLNLELKNNISELISFSKDIKSKNYDEESLNIETFRYFINMNSRYLTFFQENFKYENFFLGGILINTKTIKEIWLNRLNDIKDLIFKLIIDNNVYLSKKMEEEKDFIEKRLEQEPQTVDEYDSLVKYCENLNNQLTGIWKKIDSQQMNADLLEENFFTMKKEDFFRMWSCYGIPRYLYYKKQDTVSRLVSDRKKFKKELKQKYLTTLQDISKIRSDYESSTVISDIDNFEKSFYTFSDLNYRIEKMIKHCSTLNDHQVIIGIKVTDLSEIKEIYSSFINYYQLWEAVYNFESSKVTWMNDNLKKIDRKALKNTYDTCQSTIDKLEKTVFRKDKPAPNQIIQLLREKIREFQPYLPILYDLINPDFKPNHINDLSKSIGVEIPDDLNINMQELISRGITDHIEGINERSSYATGQKKLASNLEKFKERFKTLKLDSMFFKDTDLLVLKDTDPVSEEIDQLLTKVVSMSSSKFAKYLQKDIQALWQNLAKSQEVIDIWLKVQKLIQQQQQIFVFGDLKKQLQEEVSKYDFVEKQWRGVMDQLKFSPLVSEICILPKIKETFVKSLQTLEDVNKSLNAYLNTKRDVFPRFYFVSNEELIMMLAQCGDPKIIAINYIQQVFEGMKKLGITSREEVVVVNIGNHLRVERNSNFHTLNESQHSINQDNGNNHLHQENHVTNTVVNTYCTFESMMSEQGELVEFNNVQNPYEEIYINDEKITKAVALEKWLLDLEKEMIDTLKSKFLDCYKKLISKEISREDWAGQHIEQAILTMSQMDWTSRTSEAIMSMSSNINISSEMENVSSPQNALKELYEHEKQSLLNLIKKIRSKDNSKLLKKTLVSLIIQDVHANDVISYLIENDVNSLTAFEWISQLRYYFLTAKGKQDVILGINVRMLNTERAYDYEYLGNQKRLVITPLTDRCYRTMMEALHNCLGGAPEGPAGTGKTETIKDLSKNLGKKCFTYNCSEESDYLLMTKFFKGIAMSGCWVCFDEFNRISVDVLSVIAYQISILLTALKTQSVSCIFEGATIPFNNNMGVFITMNPDYAGRSDLPDNLKGLFRPLAMMIPNYDMITEIMLYSFGFNKARNLARKIVSSLRLASEQLSSQTHYDYGMRTLNGIINYIGILSAERNQSEHEAESEKDSSESKNINEKNMSSEEIEEYIVQKAIRDSNMPKFIADDYKIYEGILSDLFPHGEFFNKSDNNLISSIKNQMNLLKLTDSDFLISKVVDFNNIMSVRHAVMIVGEPMAHKSTILKIYLEAISEYFKNQNLDKGVKYNIINPKSITSAQLFGYVNKKSMDFYEGVCSKVLRDYFADLSNDLKFLVFDGPVDTMWIENMNSVLDDTKKLCLENSDQIRLDEKTFIIFEVDDLSQASLATISRCGMVYTDRNNISSSDYFSAWIKSFPDSYHETNYLDLIRSLFENFYEPLVNNFLFNEYNTLLYKVNVSIHKNWLMKSFINILESLLFTHQTKAEITENELEKLRIAKEHADSQITVVEASSPNRKLSTLRTKIKKSVSKAERVEIFNKFIYSILVTLCWILDSPKDQKSFIEKIFEISKDIMNVHTFILKEELLHFTKNFLGKDLTDYIFNTHDNQWIQVSEYITNSRDIVINKIRDNINNESVVIPTVQTYKAFNIVKHCQHSSNPIMFYGHTASGKSLLMKDYLITNSSYLNENNWISYTFILNSKTSANNMCDLLEEKISFKLKKNTVAPPNNKKGLILIEDLNMPVKEKYGAQPPIEILRQFFDYGGWYDRKEKDFLYLKNLLIFSFITVGRPLVSGRLLWHHIPFPMTEMDEVTLKDIYSTYFNGKFFNYPQTVRKLQTSFVEIIVNSYKNILKAFRPLPATPHYCYNVRDLNKLFEGLTMIKQEIISTRMDIPDYMLNLLLHETMRIFGDRLINDFDRNKFMNTIVHEIHKNLKQHTGGNANSAVINYDMVLFTEINDDITYQKVSDVEKLKETIYKYIEDYNCNKKAKDKMDLILFDYSLKHLLRIDRILTRNNEHGVLIGLTGSGRQSLTYIASFIKNYKVLQTRSRDQVEEYTRKEWLEDVKNLYTFAGLRREDSVFMVKDNSIPEESMYVDLNCIISSGIVYNLFTNDEKSEWLGSIKQMKEYEDLANLDDQAVWEIFLQRTMEKIRIILCMNPLNQNFTKILRSFPALINNTSIGWYEAWPEPALFYLAQREFSKLELNFSKEVKLNEILKEVTPEQEPLSSEISELNLNLPSSILDNQEYNDRILNILSKIFSKSYTLLTHQNEEYFKQTRKKVIILPKSYLDFINFFKSHYEIYKTEVDTKIKKYSDGVKKIEEADIEIKKMKETLEIKKPLLVEKGKYIETTIKDIEAQTKEAEEFAKQCEENERIAFEKRQQAEYKKLVAEKNKAEAEILKEEIFKKIMQIDNKQFMALRSFRNPPKEITKMMQAISIIMSNWDKKPLDIVPSEWEFFKKKLNDVKLLKQLESLAKKLETSLLQDKVVKLLEPFISDPDLDPAYMEKKISSTCACFCVYFKNMYILDDLLKNKIIPSIKEAESATATFTEAQENLDVQKRNLREVEHRLNVLKASFNEKNHDKLQLEIEISETQKKLIRAERLTSSLKSEKKRWKEISEEEEKNKIFLFGDIIISTIYITFMGPYLNFFREEFIKNSIFPLLDEEKILYNKHYSVSKIIGNPFKIQDWIINGLPSDNGSIDNAIILFETNKQILFIDPQKQAISFLNKLYKQDFCIFKKAESLSGGSSNSVKEAAANFSFIENCIKNGKILVFDYISFDISSEADMLLNAEIVNLPNGKVLRMNEQDIPLHPKFKFYLVSYLENPSFNPDLYGKILIINFSVTKSGLSEQLLSVIVKEESPKDEMERIIILQNRFQLEETISKMESQILEKLNVSSETLLDNDALIVNLEESKKLSDEAQLQINSAKITEEKLQHFRMFYLPLANLSTLIFFTISELNFIEDIYQFSISWFIKDILINSIKSENLKEMSKDPNPNQSQSNKTLTFSEKIEKKVEILTKSLLEKAYVAVCRSLLNKDKLLFSFLMLLRKLISTGELTEEEMQFLLTDSIKSLSNTTDDTSLVNFKKLRPEYLETQKWDKILKLNQIDSYRGIAEEICTYNTKQWKEYLTQVNPGLEFPEKYNEKNLNLNNLSPIKKLLLIKIVNLENLTEYIKLLISQYFNSEELSRIPLFTINDLLEMSNFSTPLMMILTSGIDPSGEVKRIAEENNKELVTISLGQGQAKKALANIELCQKRGFWVFLQNLHLVPDFMKNLEQIISNLQSEDKSEVDPNFRLWLSTLPTNNILPSILVNSLKITLESPVGVKANLLKLLKSQNKIWQYDLDGMKRVNKEYEFSKFFISLMHFHSILLERKNYGPLGWNVKYSFNESDFLISKMILKNNLDKHSLAIQQGGNVMGLPYKALIYLTADCIYGGRVTDDWDRRTLFSILEDFYNDTVIHEDMYLINELPEYKIEYYESIEEYFNQFNSLPESQNPEVLGLHKNALIRKQMEESTSMLVALSGLDKNDTSQSSGSSKVMILNSIFENVNKKLVKSFNIEEVKKKYPIKYDDCMNSILIQEIMRYNSLLNLVFKSLNETLQAFQGLLPLSDSLEEIAQQLISNRTPSQWIKSSYPSRKPIGSWINDLADRLNFFTNWINVGTPEKFWISAFYFTQSFLTGIKQNFARKYRVSIDKLEFNFLFVDSKELEEEWSSSGRRKDGYFTYGLFIEGARWNSNLHCVDELSGKNINDIMPPIILTVKDVTNSEDEREKLGKNKEKHFIYQ
jgi:dynein heavy chain, axonemal